MRSLGFLCALPFSLVWLAGVATAMGCGGQSSAHVDAPDAGVDAAAVATDAAAAIAIPDASYGCTGGARHEGVVAFTDVSGGALLSKLAYDDLAMKGSAGLDATGQPGGVFNFGESSPSGEATFSVRFLGAPMLGRLYVLGPTLQQQGQAALTFDQSPDGVTLTRWVSTGGGALQVECVVAKGSGIVALGLRFTDVKMAGPQAPNGGPGTFVANGTVSYATP